MNPRVLAAVAALTGLSVVCLMLAARWRKRRNRSKREEPSAAPVVRQKLTEAGTAYAVDLNSGSQRDGTYLGTSGGAAEGTTDAAADTKIDGAPPGDSLGHPSLSAQVVPAKSEAACAECTLPQVSESAGTSHNNARAAAKAAVVEAARYQSSEELEPRHAASGIEPPPTIVSPKPTEHPNGPPAEGSLESLQSDLGSDEPVSERAGSAEPSLASSIGSPGTSPAENSAPARLVSLDFATRPTNVDSVMAAALEEPILDDEMKPPGKAICANDPDEAAADSDQGSNTQTSLAGSGDETSTANRIELPPVARAPRPPRQYKPVAPAARRLRRKLAAVETNSPDTDRPLPICVRLVFERAGFCTVSLLARRRPGLPEQMPIDGTGNPGELAALQEDWYQDVLLTDFGQALRTGISWCSRAGSGERARWALSGREIVVLAPHEDLSGFVSCARLVIGEEHVVLCTPSYLAAALEAIGLAGSPQPVELETGTGVPDGWVGLRRVVPRNAVAQSGSGEILDVLRPLAQAEIVLSGGIRIARSCWLAGHPPEIRLRGDVAAADGVYIDDYAARANTSGAYQVPGWDSRGEHLIRCTSGTRTYRIADGRERWEAWDAYTWSVGGGGSTDVKKVSICGPLVLPPRTPGGHRMLVLPAANPVLVGARPGDIYTSNRRSDIRAHELTAFPPFEAVWALPADVFHCSKQSRIVSVQAITPTRLSGVRYGASDALRVRAWCNAILDASRKRLSIQSTDPVVHKLWDDYRRAARAVRSQLK